MPPDRETLAAIAEYTGAESFDAESADALEKVYAGLGSRVGRQDKPREVTAMFVAAARSCSRGAGRPRAAGRAPPPRDGDGSPSTQHRPGAA